MSNKPIDKPSWLTALNGKKEQPLAPTDEVLQEPAVLEVGEDESVAALPKYDTPPDLDLGPKQAIGRGTRVPEPVVIKNITEPTSSTKLPFPFDAEAFGRHVYIPEFVGNDESDVEEWDDDCPDCVGAEELPAGTMAGLFKDPKGLEPGTYTTQLNDKLELVNVMPFMPNEEALLPEPKIGLEDREVLSSESWLGLMTPTESIAYDNHTTLVMQSNPLHAAHLIRLKGFRSKYFQEIITTPERAEEHIRVAIVKGEDPGGWDNSDHRRVKQAQQLIAKGFEVKAKQEARQRHRLYIQQTRDAWKQAVEYRKSALEILDTDVANKKETFQLARDMTFNEYMARFEPGD